MSIDYRKLLDEFDVPEPVDLSFSLARHQTKRYGHRDLHKIKRIVVHTTDWATSPKRIAEYDIEPNHISKTGCPAITYHEMIGVNGEPYKTLSYEEVSWHVGIWNTSSVGIALCYKCTNKKGEDVYKPKKALLKTLHARCGEMCLKFGLTPDRVVGHRELKGTGWILYKGSKKLRKTCPGIHMNLREVRKDVARYMQIVLGINGFYTDVVDGIFGPISTESLVRYRMFKRLSN